LSKEGKHFNQTNQNKLLGFNTEKEGKKHRVTDIKCIFTVYANIVNAQK